MHFCVPQMIGEEGYIQVCELLWAYSSEAL